MKNLYKIIALFLFLSASSYSQVFIQNGEIGRFRNASSFTLSSAGFFYVSDASRNKIYKIDTLGKVINETGGYGWNSSAFDFPADIFTNSLNVYVADRYNRRVQIFDKDLNYLFEINGGNNNSNGRSSVSFGYPAACAVSNLGSIFILDEENKQALKFNSNGEYAVTFGGYDYGRYALNEPTGLRVISGDVSIIVDGERLLFFDSFGTGTAIITLNEKVSGINSYYDMVTVNSGSRVYLVDVKNISAKEIQLSREGAGEKIINSLYDGSSLYILYENEIEKLKKAE